MAKVALLFEDKDGEIFFRADYQGGLDPTSSAHKLANQVIKFLDAQAARKQDIQVDTEPTDVIQNGAKILAAELERMERPHLWKPGDH